MKTKEQIIDWLKSQEWIEEFCYNAGFLDEGELEEFVKSVVCGSEVIISAAFIWPEYDFWRKNEYEYVKWLNSEDEKPGETTEVKENKAEDNFKI